MQGVGGEIWGGRSVWGRSPKRTLKTKKRYDLRDYSAHKKNPWKGKRTGTCKALRNYLNHQKTETCHKIKEQKPSHPQSIHSMAILQMGDMNSNGQLGEKGRKTYRKKGPIQKNRALETTRKGKQRGNYTQWATKDYR